MEKFLEKLVELGVSLGGKIIAAVLVFIAGRFIISRVKSWIKTTDKLDKLDDGVRTFTVSFSNIILNAVLLITVAMTLGIPTTSFVTALASCGVAIGLALQGSLSNFAGGIMLLIFKPFKVGDYISTPDASGTVKSISVVYTVLSTPSNTTITIPNGTLMNSVVENCSDEDNRRADLVFCVNADSDIDKVIDILLSSAQNHPLVFKDPEPFARLTGQDANSLEFTVRAWCKNENLWDVKFDLTETVKRAFKQQGISGPYSCVDIHIKDKKEG